MESPVYPFGMGGLNLTVALDQIPVGQFSRLTNISWLPGEVRYATSRPGLLSLFVGAGVPFEAHSLGRLNDPADLATTLYAGIDQTLQRGDIGVLTVVDSGYSGLPLTLLPHRAAISGDSWMFVADLNQMRQVSFAGDALPIGLPAPGSVPSVATDAENITMIADFTADGTQAANWTVNAGATYDEPPVLLPPGQVLPVAVPTGEQAAMFLVPSISPTDFLPNGGYGYFGVAKTVDLSLVGGRPATDDDITHLWLYFAQTDFTPEFRIYLVCSPTFSPSIIPGAANSGGANTDAFVKSFNENDFAGYIQTSMVQNDAAELARVREVRAKALRARGFLKRQGAPTAQIEATLNNADVARTISIAGPASSEVWQELGVIGLPIRRGDWQRIGNTDGADWGTITGIIVFVRSGPKANAVAVGLGDFYLTGGNGPDTAEPDAVPYDYRYTHYDLRTGDEGNPSPEMAEATWVDALRQSISLTPAAYGDSEVRQRIYRRGGTRTSDWDYLGQNDADGGVYIDRATDAEASGGGTLEIDHFQPVPTVNDAGDTVLGQAVPILFGPYQGQLYALGDPHRPGYAYACIPGEPGHWPAELAVEVSPPSEPLMNGGMLGGQPFIFSTLRGYTVYPNLSSGTGAFTTAPSGCMQGLASRWAFTIGNGAMWGVSLTSVFRTAGGAETEISQKIEPLFRGQMVNGYLPIDFSTDEARLALRLQVFREELYFSYRDTDGDVQTLVYQILTGEWRHYHFAVATSGWYADMDPGGTGELLIGGRGVGVIYGHTGTADVGGAIPATLRTGAWDFTRPREEKLFGDQALDVVGNDVEITLQNFLNTESVANPTQTVTPAGSSRSRVIYDSFGASPQIARNISTELSWETAGTPPIVYFLATAITIQPDLTINRVSNWDDGGHPDQKYLMGVTFDCDTGGVDRTILIERDWNGSITTVATLTVNANGRHKLPFSWPGVPCNQMRVRPDDECKAWLLYRADWNFQPEPPRIATWDLYFENGWDQYLTGLDLYCNTEGATKRIVVEVDGTALINPATGVAYWDIVANGRRVVHLTLPWTRGHVGHLYATDANVGLLFDHRWHSIAEPSEQSSWNQPFTILGTQADKWLKAVLFEVDTFGLDKAVEIQADEHTVRTSFSVNTNGRQVVQIAFPQILGRVFRFWPIDSNPSRLYSIRPIFDEEPFSLTRWETQQIDHQMQGFHFLIDGMITLKSEAEVTLTIHTYLNQTGTIVTDAYTIPSTAGVKLKRFVPFVARKGVLYKYVFTCAASFFLYGVESQVTVQDWQGGTPVLRSPFGDDDADPTRPMVNATLAAGRDGGSA